MQRKRRKRKNERSSSVLTFEQAKEHIRRDRSLVSFVKHENTVLRHVWIDKAFPLKHAVGHVFDLGLGTRAVFETDRVANFLAETATNFFGDTLGNRHGCNTTRLCATNFESIGVTCFGEVLCHLSCLARSRVSYDNEDLILMKKGEDQRQHICINWEQS